MLSGRVKAIANEIRGTLKENDVPYGYVSVTCHSINSIYGQVEEIRIKLLKAGEHVLPNGMYLLNFICDYHKALSDKYKSDKLFIASLIIDIEKVKTPITILKPNKSKFIIIPPTAARIP